MRILPDRDRQTIKNLVLWFWFPNCLKHTYFMSVVPQAKWPCSFRRALVHRNSVLVLACVAEVEIVELVCIQHFMSINWLITLNFSSLDYSKGLCPFWADVEIGRNLNRNIPLDESVKAETCHKRHGGRDSLLPYQRLFWGALAGQEGFVYQTIELESCSKLDEFGKTHNAFDWLDAFWNCTYFG